MQINEVLGGLAMAIHVCPNCGRTIEADQAECPFCGVIIAKLQAPKNRLERKEIVLPSPPPSVPTRKVTKQKRFPRAMVVLGAVFVLLWVGTAGFRIFFTSDDKETRNQETDPGRARCEEIAGRWCGNLIAQAQFALETRLNDRSDRIEDMVVGHEAEFIREEIRTSGCKQSYPELFDTSRCADSVAHRETTQWQRKESVSKISAEVMAESFLKRTQKNPASAQFDGEQTAPVGENEFIVRGFITSTNSFNAKIRSSFACRLKHIGGDTSEEANWKIKYLVQDNHVLIDNWEGPTREDGSAACTELARKRCTLMQQIKNRNPMDSLRDEMETVLGKLEDQRCFDRFPELGPDVSKCSGRSLR